VKHKYKSVLIVFTLALSAVLLFVNLTYFDTAFNIRLPSEKVETSDVEHFEPSATIIHSRSTENDAPDAMLYSDLNYVDDLGFEFLKEVISGIEFINYLVIGDETLRGLYLTNFYRLLTGDERLYVDEDNFHMILSVHGDVYLNELTCGDFVPSNYKYYFLDFNGDRTPELGIWIEDERLLLIIKFDPVEDRFILWYALSNTRTVFIGTRRLFEGAGISPMSYAYIELDEGGNVRFRIDTYVEFFPIEGDDEGSIFLLALPNDIEMPQNISNQVVRLPLRDINYFRVSEDQFEELTSDFRYARMTSSNVLDNPFSYEDMFDMMR